MLSGEQLKFLRVYNGVTQKKVAEWCNVSIRYVGMVENNEERLSEETYNAWIICMALESHYQQNHDAIRQQRKRNLLMKNLKIL